MNPTRMARTAFAWLSIGTVLAGCGRQKEGAASKAESVPRAGTRAAADGGEPDKRKDVLNAAANSAIVSAPRDKNGEATKSAMSGGLLADSAAATKGLSLNVLPQSMAKNNRIGFYPGHRSVAPMQFAPNSFPAPGPSMQPQDATLNPNMYVSNTYMGGNGEKDRLEKLISAGVVVEGQRVKLESFARSYAQTFPIPTQTALSLTADTERAKIVTSGEHTYLQIGLQAIKGEMPRRSPLNVALVIDRSGSMSDEHKLEYAKAAAAQLVGKLDAGDTFALVAFDDRVDTLVPSQAIRSKAAVLHRIARLAPGGGTNIYGGLQAGYAELHKYARPESVNRLILLSDGEVTSGVSDPQSFHGLTSREVDRDIQTSAVGMGVSFNEDLMLSIARDGKGNYHFLKDGADTQQVFARELDELTHTVAKAIKLRVKLAEGVGLVRVLGAQTLDAEGTKAARADERKMDQHIADELGIRANRQNAPEEPGIKTLIPNFYRGDSHVVMLELAVPPGQGRRQLADVYCKYKDLVTRSNREMHTASVIAYTPDRADMIASIRQRVKKNLLGFETGEALRDAASLIAQGRIADAMKRVDERMVVLGVAAHEWNDRDLERDGKLLDRYKPVLAQLSRQPGLAQGEFGQYLSRSLTYNGYARTR